MSQGHILYQNGAASGFSLSNLSSGGYTASGGASHGTQIDCSGGAGGVIYRMTCFYTAISKNDMYWFYKVHKKVFGKIFAEIFFATFLKLKVDFGFKYQKQVRNKILDYR